MYVMQMHLMDALERGGAEALERAARETLVRLEGEIAELRGIITEARPAVLDELGLAEGLEALADRVSNAGGPEIETDLQLGGRGAGPVERLSSDVETTVYRVVQEALHNVVRHADAERVVVRVVERDGALIAEVADDGRGFDADASGEGVGLAGMRERLALVDGRLELQSGPDGTVVRASLPARRRARPLD
jgi:signal transduction histidine kinase